MEEIKIHVPDGQSGNWQIKTIRLSREEALLVRIKERNRLRRYIPHDQDFKQLIRFDREYPFIIPVMTNTPSEVKDHLPFIKAAYGDVLIFGLGLGMVVQGLLDKDNIKSITVVEKDTHVIKLSGTYYAGISNKVKIVQADALTYQDGKHYNAIWFDIWDFIAPQNLPQMRMLKRRWRKSSSIRMCWAETECKTLVNQDDMPDPFSNLDDLILPD